MRFVLLGATRGIGRAVARQLAQHSGNQLFLLGRDSADLERSARDLEVRALPSGNELTIGHAVCDLADPTTFEPAIEAAKQTLGGIDAVVVTAASFATQEELEADVDRARRLLTVNFANTVVFCELAKPHLIETGGTLCVVTSVAGDRGRKPIVLYGASKAGLSAYLEGLDHKHAGDGLHVLDVRPGFVKTSMTDGLKPPPFAGEPDGVARDIVRAIERRKPVLYTPWMWQHVMRVIRLLPRFVMRRIGF